MKKYLLFFIAICLSSCSFLAFDGLQEIEHQTPRIVWESCNQPKFSHVFGEDSMTSSPTLQCAFFEVPLDYSDKSSEKLQLSLTMEPSINPNTKDFLVLVPGGPGQSGNPFIETFSDTYWSQKIFMSKEATDKDPKLAFSRQITRELSQNFHIVSYAPRGVFSSTPYINCGYKQNPNFDIWRNPEEFVENCQKFTSERLLKNLSTQVAVEDLNEIRKGLGVEKFSVFGVSYGTKVLAYYVQKYGNHLNAGIFDSVVDVTLNYLEDLRQSSKSLHIAFEYFVDFCIQQQNCIFDDKDKASKVLRELFESFEQKNLTDKNNRKITKSTLLGYFSLNLYWSYNWQDSVDLLWDLNNGNVDALNNMISWFDDGGDEVLLAVNCADSALPFPQRNKEEYMQTYSSQEIGGFWGEFYPLQDDDGIDHCFYWPFEGKDSYKKPTKPEGTPQLMFVTYEVDAPLDKHLAYRMSEMFDNSFVLLTPIISHGSLFSATNECADKKALEYLKNPSLKQENIVCDK